MLDLDNGTYRLYWTQSITRRRWIATKLTLGVAASVAVAVCLIALTTWSRAPLDHLNGRMSTDAYDSEGIVPVAYALFVLGVAVAIGRCGGERFRRCSSLSVCTSSRARSWTAGYGSGCSRLSRRPGLRAGAGAVRT